jgi:hypothetical protein
MTRLLQAATVAAACLSLSAFAAAPTPQTHQCMKAGAVLQKTKKACHAAGGTWEKIAAAKPAPKATEAKPAEPASAPEAAPAPAAEPAPAGK